MDEYAAFAAIYDDWASHMTEDVPFYLELVREADGPVVELAVGNGRVAIPVAKETGKRIVGIDRSPALLALAKEKAADADIELELHEGDMRDFELDEPAALVYCPARALLHLPTWRDKRQMYEQSSLGAESPPPLPFFDRGTYEELFELQSPGGAAATAHTRKRGHHHRKHRARKRHSRARHATM